MSGADAGALIVGIGAYRSVRPLGPIAVKDATDIRDALVAGEFAPESVRLLVDHDATAAALRYALAELTSRVGPAGRVVIYLSGHGARTHTDEYLLPVDAVADSPESLASTAISGTEFARALRAIPARHVLVILDCCHSGGVGMTSGWSPTEGLSDRYYDVLRNAGGRVILASSRDDEFSYILHGHENSLFTRHLLAGLNGGAVDGDGVVSVFGLFEYLQPLVTVDEPRQHPVFKADLAENFPVSRARARAALAADGFRHDVYVSYVDVEPDASWVWETLLPRLETAGLSVAVSGDVEQPGVARVVGIERGIRQSRRTLVVLSPDYLRDGMAEFENGLAQTLSVQEGSYRLVPAWISDPVDALPTRIGMLTAVHLASKRRYEREFARLIAVLSRPL